MTLHCMQHEEAFKKVATDRSAQVQERGQAYIYQNCSVIKAAAAARTNVTGEIRQELKVSDPDRPRGTGVESSSIAGGTDPGTAAAQTRPDLGPATVRRRPRGPGDGRRQMAGDRRAG